MALIILDPEEVFEHCHDHESSTVLQEGDIVCSYGGADVRMRPGQSLAIPAGVSHVLRNVGRTRARIECYHKPEKKPLPPK